MMKSDNMLENLRTEKPDMGPELALNVPGYSEVSILGILVLLAKHKRIVWQVTLGTLAVAGIISILLPNRYTATAVVMPPQQTQSTSSMLMSQLAGTGVGTLAALAGKDLGLKNPNDLYIGMLKSRTVEDGIIAKFNLQNVYRKKRLSDVRKKFEKASEIDAGKDGLIHISFEDTDPNRSAEIANAYVEQLRMLTQHLAVTEASQRRLFFEQQVQQAKDSLANAEVALKETQQKTGMIQLDSQAKAMLEAIGKLKAQVAAKEVELQAMKSFATEQNPDVVLTQEQLSALRGQLAKLEKQQPTDSADPFMAAEKVPAVALEYVRRLREVKYQEAIFELLAKQYQAAKLDEAKEAAVIQTVDPAITPDKKSSPERALILGIGLIGGFFLGVVIALLIELRENLSSDNMVRHQLSVLRTYLGFSR